MVSSSSDHDDDHMMRVELSGVAHYSLIIYLILVIILSFIGNLFVLISSVFYNAIKLDRISLVLLQQLSITDIAFTVVGIIPTAVTEIAGKWVLGEEICYVQAHFQFIPAITNIHLVVALSVYRLATLSQPIKSQAVKRRHIYVIIGFLWLFSSSVTIIAVVTHQRAYFYPPHSRCTSTIYTDMETEKVTNALVGVQLVLPMVIILVSNGLLLRLAVKFNRQIAKSSVGAPRKSTFKALILVLSVAGVFFLSWMPYLISSILQRANHYNPPVLDKLSRPFVFINSFCNPIIYTLTNQRFKRYIVRRVLRCGRNLVSMVTSTSGGYIKTVSLRRMDSAVQL